MITTRTTAIRWLLALMACALTLGAIAAAPGSATAPAVLWDNQPISHMLTGNGGGAFAYYAIDYPGDGRVVTIELRYVPADPVTKLGVGFQVYGPNGYWIGQGLQMANSDGVGVTQLQYSDHNPATWLVQVYNYLPGHNVWYDIVAQGLPPVPAAPAAPAPLASPPAGSSLAAAGQLVGNGGGAFAKYDLTVPAYSSDVLVTLTWWPDDPVIATGVGFVVYGQSGEVARGDPTGRPGERSVTLPAGRPGSYLVQIYNYMPGLAIGYVLTGIPLGN